MTWSLSDGRTFAVDIETREQLLEKLEGLNDIMTNTVVGLDDFNGPSFLVGLGGEVGYINYKPKGNGPPYYSSVNTAIDAKDEGYICFEFGGAESNIPSRNLLPFETILDALTTFFETGKFPDGLHWEQD